VGRESELTKLEERLFRDEATRFVVIVGPGGIGKSQLALEFAYQTRRKKRSCLVFWVDASDMDRFDQGYLNIAKKLNIRG
ncbi:hypothetical protein CC78DRAFT_475040, partial [Lojkania enalia]